MAFVSLDPSALIGKAIEGIIGAPVIIGMPSETAKVPNFVIGIIPQEQARTSAQLSGLQITPGDLAMKSAVNPGQYTFTLPLSANATFPAEWLTTVTTVLQTATAFANSFSNFGSVIPNLSGITSNYAVAQLATLHRMRDGRQPITILNAAVTLGSISQSSPFLSSQWFIESIDVIREESEDGFEVSVVLKEQLRKRAASFTPGNLLTNLAGELVSPLAGSALGSVL